ncbi:hypothetical protein PCE1_001486 [Barthelona sp. PCE]
MFFDLGINVSSASNMHGCLLMAKKLGYSTIAVNHHTSITERGLEVPEIREFAAQNHVDPCIYFTESVNPKIVEYPNIINRLTVTVNSLTKITTLKNDSLDKFDLLAARPMNNKCFEYCCRDAAIDMIDLDLTQKLPVRLGFHDINVAISRGVSFSVSYGDAMISMDEKMMFLSQLSSLITFTRGRNIIFCSGADAPRLIRDHTSLRNLLDVVGLPFTKARRCFTSNCLIALENAVNRRSVGGAVSITQAK